MTLLTVLAVLAFMAYWEWWHGGRYFKMLRALFGGRKSN